MTRCRRLSPLPSICALVGPMSHVACRPVIDSVLGDELGARVDSVLLVFHLDRQQHLGLDPGERRGHHEVFAGDVELELALGSVAFAGLPALPAARVGEPAPDRAAQVVVLF